MKTMNPWRNFNVFCLGEKCLKNYIKEMSNGSIQNFTWEHQKCENKIVNVCNSIKSWFNGERQKCTGATLANMVTAIKHLLRFLLDLNSQDRPIPGSSLYPLFKEWEKEVDAAIREAEKLGKVNYSKRKSEAKANRMINITLDDASYQQELKAIRQLPNHKKLNQLYDHLFSIKTKQEITTELYNQSMESLAILFLLCSGQRPEIISFLTNMDGKLVEENSEDEDLYTMTLDIYNAEKRGKTKTEIRMAMDQNTYQLLLKFKWMKNQCGVQGQFLFTYMDGTVLNPQTLKRCTSWDSYDLPKTLSFRKVRQIVSSFYGSNSETKNLRRAVLLNHEDETGQTYYSTDNKQTFDKGVKALRQHLIPKADPRPGSISKGELDSQRKKNLNEMKEQLRYQRGIQIGKRNANSIKRSKSGYSLPKQVRKELLMSVLSGRVPSFTYAALTSLPRDSSRITRKPWTNLVANFLLDSNNKDLWETIMLTPFVPRQDVYTYCRILRNTLIAFNKPRRMLPGLTEDFTQMISKAKTKVNPFHLSSSPWTDNDEDDDSDVDSLSSTKKKRKSCKEEDKYENKQDKK